MMESLFNKVEEETAIEVFHCECYKIFKKAFFYKTPSAAAFVILIK